MTLPLLVIVVIATAAAVYAAMADLPFVVIILIAAAAAVCAGIVYTLRGFKASAAAARSGGSRHDPAATEQLKQFFDGKECAICKRPIPPVQRTGPKPGLLNPATHETRSWNEIPDANLSTVLQSQLPVCSECQIAESFRQRFPDLVIDRERPGQNAHAR
jgi:hypothetical protein